MVVFCLLCVLSIPPFDAKRWSQKHWGDKIAILGSLLSGLAAMALSYPPQTPIVSFLYVVLCCHFARDDN